MFRKMRRSDKVMTKVDIDEALKVAEYGNLGTINDQGYPYLTPLNYVYYNEKIYFHSAKTGEKVDNIEKNSKVSFCVVGETEILSETFDTNYKSVIVFGIASEVYKEEKIVALEQLIVKYSPEFLEKGKKYVQTDSNKIKVFAIEVEHMTGKQQV